MSWRQTVAKRRSGQNTYTEGSALTAALAIMLLPIDRPARGFLHAVQGTSFMNAKVPIAGKYALRVGDGALLADQFAGFPARQRAIGYAVYDAVGLIQLSCIDFCLCRASQAGGTVHQYE